MDFTGKRALVTGAADGIGAVIVQMLRAAVAAVAVAGRDGDQRRRTFARRPDRWGICKRAACGGYGGIGRVGHFDQQCGHHAPWPCHGRDGCRFRYLRRGQSARAVSNVPRGDPIDGRVRRQRDCEHSVLLGRVSGAGSRGLLHDQSRDCVVDPMHGPRSRPSGHSHQCGLHQ